jgi:hypothetical protein
VRAVVLSHAFCGLALFSAMGALGGHGVASNVSDEVVARRLRLGMSCGR